MSNQSSNNEKGKGQFIQKGEPDVALWQEVQRLADESVKGKVAAMKSIFDNYAILPDDADALLKKLAKPKNPVLVRREIAARLVMKPKIRWVLYLELLSTLGNDKDKKISDTVEPIFRKYKPLEEYLKNYAKQWNVFISNLSNKNFFQPTAMQVGAITNLGKFFQLQYQPTLRRIAESAAKLSTIQTDWAKVIPSVYPTQTYLNILSNLRAVNTDVIGSLSTITPSYFEQTEPITVEKTENILVKKLNDIPPGINHWRQYQTACKDILTFCFVPPLLEPVEESQTESGLHRRDILYNIPLGQIGFWGHIQNAYKAYAVIVDAKNYSDELPANQIVITSKYFGHKKLGNFGLVVSPKGPSDSARAEQRERWVHKDEMIICLSNNELQKMVALKEKNEEPEIVIDGLIRELILSI